MTIPATVQAVLTTITCSECGIAFGVPEHWRSTKRSDHSTFWCPNGHRQHYPGQSEAERLKSELEVERRRHEFTRNDRDAQRGRADRIEKRRQAQKGITTKLKRRIAAGRCPSCKTTFAQLEAHMAAEHPHYCGDEQESRK